ncbi:MAG: hypothetical protein ACMG6E_08345, partial [Candidatus Roizmanbacteria bacterium]
IERIELGSIDDDGAGRVLELAIGLSESLDHGGVESAVHLAMAVALVLETRVLNVLALYLFDGYWLGSIVELRGQLLETLQLELVLIVIVLVPLHLLISVLGGTAGA